MSLLILLLIMSSTGYSQEIDILLKGGHVIDPANHIDAVMDVAISDGRIAKVAPGIPVYWRRIGISNKIETLSEGIIIIAKIN